MRIAIGLTLFATAATAADAPGALRPGLWEVRSTPVSATLDGRALDDLPFTMPPDEKLCMTAQQAASPAQWLARDNAADCTLTRSDVGGGRVDIRGTCPPNDEGQKNGSVSLTGSWSAERYDLRFDTVAHGLNGTMGFGGTVTGRRVGDCPAG